MDLNYLLQRQQIALHRAQHAACDQSRHAHQDMADSYGEQIAELRTGAAAQQVAA